VYTDGHPNGAIQALAALLAAAEFEFYFSGDLDPEGIQILQELTDAAEKPVKPVRMDRNTFDRYFSAGDLLGESMLRRLRLIRKEIRVIPGIGGLIKRIEETGMGIDQEIIDYT
jgi:hypothetical protein